MPGAPFRSRARSLRSLFVIWLGAGCIGDIGEGDPDLALGVAPALGPTVGGKTAVMPGPGSAVAVPAERMPTPECKAVDPGPAFARRLTRHEYDNTIRDLLGDTSRPAKDFPTEERVEGFDNNASALGVSPVLLEQYYTTADELATGAVATRLPSLLGGCDPVKDAEDACARRFFDSFGRRAFRRPPTTDELTLLQGTYATGKIRSGFKGGVRLALTVMLMSPPFLYRIEQGIPPKPGEAVVRLSGWEMASRLSYLLWSSMPDEALFTAAAMDRLATREQVSAQVLRMLADPRARDVSAHFYDQWLDLEKLDRIVKDTKAYPGWNPALAAAMKQETRQFVDDLFWKSEGDLTALLAAPFTYVNTALAQHYGLPVPGGSGFVKATLDGTKRGGVLSQGALMAMLAHANQTSPVLRGKFVREQLLCTHPPDPPDDVSIEIPKIDPTLTTRERFAQHMNVPACVGCHRLMDPIGLGFESFDPVGRWREREGPRSIDVSGQVFGVSGDMTFDGAMDLGRKLAQADEVRGCLVTRWFQYGYGRMQTESDACSLIGLQRRMASGGYKLRDLLVALTETDAFLYRRVVPPGGAQ